VFVQRGLYDKFLTRLVERVKVQRIGDPMHDDTRVGAMINEGHMNKVLGFVKAAREEVSCVYIAIVF
jgi:acyl-CoA reductase-like NAD-dependent aldehyde dehydrogenase